MNEDPLLVLVDTNVWISAFIRADGAPAKVLQAFLERRFVPVISQTLLDEIQAVIKRPRIRRRSRLADDELAAIMQRLRDHGVESVPTGTLHLCRDPHDDFLLETAIHGGAHVAVTRDDDIKRDVS